MTRTRLKHVCGVAQVPCQWVKEPASLLSIDPTVSIAVVALADLMGESDEFLRLLAQHLSAETTICFYPHVESDLARRALSCGFKRLVTRSKVDQTLQELLLKIKAEANQSN